MAVSLLACGAAFYIEDNDTRLGIAVFFLFVRQPHICQSNRTIAKTLRYLQFSTPLEVSMPALLPGSVYQPGKAWVSNF